MDRKNFWRFDLKDLYLNRLLYRGNALFLLYRRFPKGNALFFCGVLLFLLTGCGAKTVVTTKQPEANPNPFAAVVSMEDTPIVDYVVPHYTPGILINRTGYDTEGEKLAYVYGTGLPKTFSLIDRETGLAVYTGKVEESQFSQETGFLVGELDFTEYKQTGNFYLECDRLGRSLTFPLEENHFEGLFQELYGKIEQSIAQKETETNEAFALLLSYEWYSDRYKDEDGDGVPDVLRLLTEFIDSHTMEDILDAAFLAKFGYLYQEYDWSYATKCLQWASVLYTENQGSLSQDADNFMALTELYRATGLYTYRKQIEAYAAFFNNNGSYLEKDGYLYGAMTYMNTRQKVDMKLCTVFVNDIMRRGEEISSHYKEILHPVTAKNNGCDDLVRNAIAIGCANYIMDNYQYNHILHEFWDYLAGKNKDSVCFYPEQGNRSDYILLLSQLTVLEQY